MLLYHSGNRFIFLLIIVSIIFIYGCQTVPSDLTPVESPTASPSSIPEPSPTEDHSSYLIFPGKGIGPVEINKSSFKFVSDLIGENGVEVEEGGETLLKFDNKGLTFWFEPEELFLSAVLVENNSYHTEEGIKVGSTVFQAEKEYTNGYMDLEKRIYYADDGTDYHYDKSGEIIKIYISKRNPVREGAPTPVASALYVSPEMVLIQGGTFEMGDSVVDWERVVHTVTVSSFYMGKTEVTYGEYILFDPSYDTEWNEPDLPVADVSWDKAIEYCNWLSDKAGLERCYSGSGKKTKMDLTKKGYRLPTEAEWEYACKAGGDEIYFWGSKCDDSYLWYNMNSDNRPHPVGTKNPNPWGLYDMSGNVWEWCWDFKEDYLPGPATNPTGPLKGYFRVKRGGSYKVGDIFGSCANRSCSSPNKGMGFRVVRSY